MNDRTDVLVIGGGHNGLAAACLMAMKGQQVVIVEQRDAPGGLAAPVEFAPGFRSAGVWHDTGSVSKPLMDSLGLQGLVEDEPQPILAFGAPGQACLISGAADRMAFDFARYEPANGKSYARYRAFMKQVQPVFSRFLTGRPFNFLDVEHEAPAEVMKRALGLRFLGASDMVELLRVAPMPVKDFLDEYFESDFIKGALAMNAALGTFTAPRSPGTTMNLLMHESMAGRSIRGGGIALTEALVSRAGELGVRIRTGSAVTKILVEQQSARGVELEDGSVIKADAVSASVHPRAVLLDLLPIDALTHTTEHRISNYRTRGTTAQLLLAVDGPVTFDGGADQVISRARIAPTLDYVEKAFDAVKYDRFSDEPVLDVAVPSIGNPGLAPAGKSVVSVLVSYAPYNLEGGWTDEAKDQMTARVVDILSRYVPGIETKIVGSMLSSPVDLENDFGLTGGHLHHGEPALDQVLVRPIPECFNHETPVQGLTLCGSGTHPGGTVSCMAGALATRKIVSSERRTPEIQFAG